MFQVHQSKDNSDHFKCFHKTSCSAGIAMYFFKINMKFIFRIKGLSQTYTLLLDNFTKMQFHLFSVYVCTSVFMYDVLFSRTDFVNICYDGPYDV